MSASTTPAPEIRAIAFAGNTLHAPVRVLGDLAGPRVKVETLTGGAGGWARPGKQLVVSAAILRDVVEVEPTPAGDAVLTPVDEPAEVVDETPAEDTRSPELIAAEAELSELTNRIAAHWDRHHGTSRLRGKQHNQRVDAAIRRAARMAEQHRVLTARVNRLRAKEA